MFIKVTRFSDDEQKFEMILPAANIKSVCTGYENRGSRLQLIGARDEIHVEESVSEIWRMVGGK
jgi:hypothetical protein